MPDSPIWVFDSYQLDLVREQLRREQVVVTLTHKAFAVLCYLVAHAGELVTREALMETVWPGVFVSDAA